MTVVLHTPRITPIPEELLGRWRRIPVAVAVDLAPECQIDPAIRPMLPAGQQPALFGRAVTVRCVPPDFGAVLHAVGTIGPGDVLLINAGGYAGCAMIGDVLGGHLHRRGAAGVICDGAIRDIAGLSALQGLSVYSRSINPKGPTNASEGEVNSVTVIGGCSVSPGDLVAGDDDGLFAISPSHLPALIAAAEAKLELEASWTARLKAGDPVTDIFGLI